MLRTVNDQPTLWESVIPECLMGLPGDLADIDALLDDPAFFEGPSTVTRFGEAPTSAVDAHHPVIPGSMRRAGFRGKYGPRLAHFFRSKY